MRESLHTRIVAYLSILVALGALLVSYSSYRHAKNTSESLRVTDVELETRIHWEQIDFDSFSEDLVKFDLDKLPRDSLVQLPFTRVYNGLSLFITTKVYNKSAHATSIDRVSCWHAVNGTLIDGLEPSQCYDNNLEDEVVFPIFLKPHEQARFFVKTRWPVSEEIIKIYADLEPNRLHSWQEMVTLYEEAAGEYRGYFQPPSQKFASIVQHRFNLRSPEGTSDRHWLRISVHLASGEELVNRIDFGQ